MNTKLTKAQLVDELMSIRANYELLKSKYEELETKAKAPVAKTLDTKTVYSILFDVKKAGKQDIALSTLEAKCGVGVRSVVSELIQKGSVKYSRRNGQLYYTLTKQAYEWGLKHSTN